MLCTQSTLPDPGRAARLRILLRRLARTAVASLELIAVVDARKPEVHLQARGRRYVDLHRLAEVTCFGGRWSKVERHTVFSGAGALLALGVAA